MLFFTLFISVGLGMWFLFVQKQFGRSPSGSRLARIKKTTNYHKGTFRNLSPTPVMVPVMPMWKLMQHYFGPAPERRPAFELPSQKTDLRALPEDEIPTVIWFGHSSYLIKVAGQTVLVDPVFSGHASPVSFIGKNYPGSNLYSPDDMPPIDVLLLTHDHYDHLDYETVRKLLPKVRQVVASLGVGAHLERWGYPAKDIRELAWHESAALPGGLHFTALPARHFSGRLFKRGQTLWASFMVQTPAHRLYLGGDSGYDTHFADIGRQYGPFDLAVLECGQYGTNWPHIHLLPEQTTQAALDLKAKVLLPVHWAKFTLALHAWDEPIERVMLGAAKVGLPLATPMIGQMFRLDGPLPNRPWWRHSAESPASFVDEISR